MKVLLVIGNHAPQRLLVKLPDQKAIEKVVSLINKKQHTQAIVSALTVGSFEKEIRDDELPTTRADMVLSEHSVSWDLMR